MMELPQRLLGIQALHCGALQTYNEEYLQHARSSIGYITPFTTRAKVLIQDLWKEELGWDNPISLRACWTNGLAGN
jgi:hypothetical protein